MRFIRPLALMLVVWACLQAQEVVDRMAAVVNKQVILESELDQALRIELLLAGKPLSPESQGPEARQAVLGRLIDQALLEQQIAHPEVLGPTPEELAARVKEVRDQIPGASGDQAWKALLQSYGVTEQDLEKHLISEIRILRLVDLRFRGLVHIDKTAIAGYYENKLVPELHGRGAAVPPLASVSDKIEKILIEQNMSALLDEWLETLRSQAHIERMIAPVTSAAGGAKQ
jgi:peptidyl-prolyl cis-trans isomerase SurA